MSTVQKNTHSEIIHFIRPCNNTDIYSPNCLLLIKDCNSLICLCRTDMY